MSRRALSRSARRIAAAAVRSSSIPTIAITASNPKVCAPVPIDGSFVPTRPAASTAPLRKFCRVPLASVAVLNGR